MSTSLLLILAVVLVSYLWYAAIIKRRNQMEEALSGIDVQLKKRADLIPNILKIAKKFMEHEKELLTRITELREKVGTLSGKTDAASMTERFSAENELGKAMSGLMVQVENYPDLKSQETMVNAQHAYADVEENIAAARRFYNAAVRSLRNSIQIFPGTIFAGMLGIEAMPFLQFDEADKKPVNADDYL